MIAVNDAIRLARSMIGTPYSRVDCIGLIKWIIRQAPGGVTSYTTAGTNSLWKSYDMSAKYRDLTWRQEGIQGAQAGMLAFKRSGEDVHHVGLVTGEGTVIHSSSARGQVVETELDGSWALLGIHRYIEAAGAAGTEDNVNVLYQEVVSTQSGALNVRDAPDGGRIGSLPKGTTVDVLAEPAQGWTFVRSGSLMGYVSSAYLTRIETTDAVEIEPETVAEAVEATTLMRDDGTCVTLMGTWRVAED
ncbi:MAG: SH3 domain-containing protein [Clostridiales bacterium]|nr:SH3 domain-containing protein [Clostridiales bacterium]MDY5513445.1 SH3 domain-containing protein [Candidatus Ventricola sp.]